jgi:hypothetical protein
MFSSKFTKKRVLTTLSVVGILAIAAVAFAYWTASGTGSGTASVGSDSGVTINNVAFDGDLYPGHEVTVTFDVVNGSADAKAKVEKVIADVGEGTNGISGLPAGCSADDFHFSDVSVDTEIDESATVPAEGTLAMDNTSVNQDACKDAAPVLHLTTDNSGI